MHIDMNRRASLKKGARYIQYDELNTSYYWYTCQEHALH